MDLTRPVLVLAALLVAPLALAACSESQSSVAPTAAPAPAVSVVTVKSQAVPIVSDLPGRIAPTRIAEVRPRVSGIVVKRVFEQGEHALTRRSQGAGLGLSIVRLLCEAMAGRLELWSQPGQGFTARVCLPAA